MERIQHDLKQGSEAWHQFRLEHNGASEAAAMLGLSKKVQRNELLRIKHTGIAKEFSDFVQEHILDYGHEVEALARPLVEELIGEELYPATYSYGKKSASTDGLTMLVKLAFEHKQWNEKLAAIIESGVLPEEFQPQCQQIMDVTGAERLIFVMSDGTRENFVYIYVSPDPEWVKRIDAGWDQFDEDLLTYKPPELPRAVMAAPIKELPALSIQVKGKISLIDNMPLFGAALRDFIGKIPEEPKTDQEFADCKAACTALKDAENALDAAEANALGQVASFDEMKRAKALLFDLARNARLALEKLVVAKEKEIKEGIVIGGKIAFTEHITLLNKRLGLKPNGTGHMPIVPVDFATVIKNKRTVTSLQNAVDTELARAKIAANAIADAIQINLNTLRDMAGEYKALFADTPQLIQKSNEDLVTLITLRITQHKAELQKREDEARERIRQEELARIDAEAKAKAEQVARDAAAALVQAAPAPAPVPAVAPAPAPATSAAAPAAVINVAPPMPSATTMVAANAISGIAKLRVLIDEGVADMSAGELQQTLDAVRRIREARQQRRSA